MKISRSLEEWLELHRVAVKQWEDKVDKEKAAWVIEHGRPIFFDPIYIEAMYDVARRLKALETKIDKEVEEEYVG